MKKEETCAERLGPILNTAESIAARHPSTSSGVYVILLTEGARVRAAAYGPNYGRLAQIKRKYDPYNLFHMNRNIEPA